MGSTEHCRYVSCCDFLTFIDGFHDFLLYFCQCHLPVVLES